jgi:hypothetical protein
MDVYKAIRELYEEKEKLDRVIASLEALQNAAPEPPLPGSGSRRGRKSMDPQERRAVSERMKRYWARRRKDGQKGERREEQASVLGESA